MTRIDLASAFSALFNTMPVLEMISRNPEACLVGGAVRDALMGRIPTDYDVLVPDDPESLAKELSSRTGMSFFKMGKNRQTVFRGQLNGHTLDLVRMAGDAIESDLYLRDFTMNAMAIQLKNRSFLDPTQGREDISARTVRMVSEQAFLSDPLRLLRAYRFAAAFEFKLETRTESAIRAHGHLVVQPAGERIREELIKLLAAACTGEYLIKMADSGLLFHLFPELSAEMACTQNHHHRFTVLEHTLKACRHLELFLAGKEAEAGDILEKTVKEIDDRLRPLIMLSMLFHDLGKPLTRVADDAGYIHFRGHEKKSAELAGNILTRLRFSVNDAQFICLLIQNHLRPLWLYQAHQHQTLSRKGLVRFFRSLGTYAPHLLIHALADACAKTKTPSEMDPSFSAFIYDLLKFYDQDFLPRKKEPALITGKDLIAIFGLKPSPVFKIILDAVEEARMLQTLASREEAMDLVKTRFLSNGNRH